MEESSELEVQIDYINKLFELLGWSISKKPRKRRREVRLNITEGGKRADYTFSIGNVAKFVVEAKKATVDIRKNEFLMQALNYALNAGVSWAVITNFKRFIVLDVDINSKNIKNKIILDVEYKNYANKFGFEKLLDFSRNSIKNNILEEKQSLSGRRRKKIGINVTLMKEILGWRELMYNNLKRRYKQKSPDDIEDYILEILNRLIFIRSCEDKGYMSHETLKLSRNINEEKSKNYLKPLFDEYEQKYDGHLFKKIDYFMIIEAKLLKKILYHLNFSKNKKIKFDFKVISIDVLGTVYEEYLGQVAEEANKRKKAKGKSKKRKEGIYYTPNHIVRAIIENTVIPLLDKKGLDKIKILDPACGSGSFLITALRVLFDFSEGNLNYKRKINLIKHHILGIDKDSKAVEITKLNLCLSLIEEKDKHERLPDLNQNILWGNSLTEFESTSPYDKYDVIITNPPYGADFPKEEKDKLKELFPEIYKGEIESYALFYYTALKHLKKGGYIGFVTPDGWLTNKNFDKLRSYFVKNGIITRIIDTYKPFLHAKDVHCHIIVLKKVGKKEIKRSKVKITRIDPYTCREKEPKIKKEYLIGWNYFKRRNTKTWHPYQDSKERQLVKKMNNVSKPLSEDYRVVYGLRTGENIRYITKKKTKTPLVSGRDFEQYKLNKINTYLKSGKFDKIAKKYSGKEKLVIQYVRTNKIDETAPWLEAMIVPKKAVGLNSTNMIFIKKDKYSLKFLLGLLNSQLMNRYYRLHYTDVNVKSEYLSLLPIPKKLIPKQIKKVEELVDFIILNKKRNNIKATKDYIEKLEIFLFKLYNLNYKKYSKIIFCS